MEPLTHFLTGACLGRTGLNRKTALATLTLTLAAEAPDLDILGQFRGPAFGFAHHRGFTHSFLGVPIMAAVVIAFVYGIWRLRGRKTKNDLAPRWRLLFFYACLAGLSHILLDFTNNYGVRPFWPFYEKWYSWDIVFIFEPVMFVLLVLGLVLPAFSALIDKEIGAHSRGPRGRLAAWLALVGVLLMWGLRDSEHKRAVSALESRTYDSAEPLRVSAYPTVIDPFHWFGVVETTNFFVLAPVDTLSTEVDPEGRLEVRYKPEETAVTMAAKRSYLGRVYLDWAQYPITETETETLNSSQEGYLVHLQDLRYAQTPRLLDRILGRSNGPRKMLGATVQLDKNLRPIAYIFGPGKKQAADSGPAQ